MTLFLLAATPLPVHVADTVHTAAEMDWTLFWMTILGTAASAAVAVFTAVLAARTNALARETKRMADKTADLAAETLDSVKIARSGVTVADQHHQESQSSILIASEISWQRDSMQSGSAPPHLVLIFQFKLANLGDGPAVNVTVRISLPNNHAEGEMRLTPLAAGQARAADRCHVDIPDLKPSDGIPISTPVAMTLSYYSVFGGLRTTTYDLRLRQGQMEIASEVISTQEIVARIPDASGTVLRPSGASGGFSPRQPDNSDTAKQTGEATS